MTTTEHRITGMTGGHCISAVSSELVNVDGATDVTVDLDTSIATVTSATALDAAQVRRAVGVAGYELFA